MPKLDPHRRRLLAWLSLGTGLAAGAGFARVLSRAWRAAGVATDDPAAGPICAPPRATSARATRATALAPSYEHFVRPLPLPRADGLLADLEATMPLRLVAQSGDFAVLPGAPTSLWHYAANVDGRPLANPTLRVKRGASIDVELDNRLAEATTIHWHGLAVDEANDGGGLHPVKAGARTRYRFEVRNRAGLYWYHAHPHMRTGVQVQRGMAGLVVVEDDEEHALRQQLGLVPGETDLTLMLADKQLGADHAILYRDEGADDWVGNAMLVNWIAEPYLDVTPQLYRLRLANTSNARLLRLAFVEPGGGMLPFHLIGTDGGLLAESWRVEDVFVAPAQRIDLLVDFAKLVPGARVRLRSLAYDAMEYDENESGELAADPLGDHPGAIAMGHPLDLMELRVGAAKSRNVRRMLPRKLSSLAPTPDTKDWPLRKLRLRMNARGDWFINDWNFHNTGHRNVFEIKRGSREIWEIQNAINSMPHAMHLHGFQFRVLSRSISPPDVRAKQVAPGGLSPQDLGVLDTVVVWPGETVRIALDFAQPYRGAQRYMFHCHNLEHEDKGMMVTFAVVD